RAAVDAGRGDRDEEHAVEARILADRGLVAPLVVECGHSACDRAVLAHAFHNASPRGPELAGIGHPPLAGGGPDPLVRRPANFGQCYARTVTAVSQLLLPNVPGACP